MASPSECCIQVSSITHNEELTAEKWKERFEREREKVDKLHQLTQSMEEELTKWRAGDKVPEEDWVSAAEQLATRHVAAPSTITDDERHEYEERAKLYAQPQLDEKDEEFFSAIQKMAINLENKKMECAKLATDNDKLAKDLAYKNLEVALLSKELTEMRGICTNLKMSAIVYKKQVHESVRHMFKDLPQLGDVVNFNTVTTDAQFIAELNDADKSINDKLLAHAIMCVSKLSRYFKANQQKLLQLESDRDNVQKKMDKMNEDLAACKLHIQQLEAKNKALQFAVEVEQKQVRQLEEDKDALNAKVVAMQTTFEQICAELQQQHAKLVAQLRDQMAEKNGQIKKLTESLEELQSSHAKLSNDYDRLSRENLEKEERLKALPDKYEMAKEVERERIAKWRAALSEEKQDEKRMKACEGMKRTRAKKTPEEKELNNAKRRKSK